MSEITKRAGHKSYACETFDIPQRGISSAKNLGRIRLLCGGHLRTRLRSTRRGLPEAALGALRAWSRQDLWRVEGREGRRSDAAGADEPPVPSANLSSSPCPLRLASVLRHRIYVPLLILTLIFCPGCTIWRPLNFKDVVRRELSEFYKNYYEYPHLDKTAQILAEEKKRGYLLKTVEIPLHLPPELTVKNLEQFKREVEELAKTDQKTANDKKLLYTNQIDFYLPDDLKPGQRRPVILISPILGGNMVVDHFARFYARRGFIAALVHRKRILWDDERKDIQQIEDYLRTSVIRLRQALDWILEQPEVDPDRIGSFGISYGAILHSVLAAVEPRIHYHVLAMPAAPLADVIIHCPDKAIVKLVKKVHENYGWPREEIHRKLKETLRTDPLYLAPYVPKDRVQVYVALFDRVVGAKRSFKLWRALGRPTLKILPFGHYGGLLVFPYLQTQSSLAFKWHLRK